MEIEILVDYDVFENFEGYSQPSDSDQQPEIMPVQQST